MTAKGKTSQSEIIESLRECPLFRDLSEQQIQVMATAFHIERYEAGERIFRQGDLGSRIYLIREGEVRLERTVNLGTRKANMTISVLRRHRLVGCWACLFDEYRHLTESAVCQKQTQVITAKGADLKTVMENDSRLTVVMLRRLCSMLGDKVHDAYCAMDVL